MPEPITNGMPRKKTTKVEPEPDRHKPSRMVRVPKSLADRLDSIASREWTTFPTQVMLAIEMYLRHKEKPT